jgi:hypothetical protein
MTQASNVGVLTPKINSSGQLDATTGLTGSVPVANGGTGAATYTANNVLLGNGTSAFQVVAPGTTGNVLTSNGTTWSSSAPASSGGANGMNRNLVTTTGTTTWTVPTGISAFRVICVGGGSARNSYYTASSGSGGGMAIRWYTGITPGTVASVTVGIAGISTNPGAAGGTSSFSVSGGTTISATGGGAASSSNAVGGVGSGGQYNYTGNNGGSISGIETLAGYCGGTDVYIGSYSYTCTTTYFVNAIVWHPDFHKYEVYYGYGNGNGTAGSAGQGVVCIEW